MVKWLKLVKMHCHNTLRSGIKICFTSDPTCSQITSHQTSNLVYCTVHSQLPCWVTASRGSAAGIINSHHGTIRAITRVCCPTTAAVATVLIAERARKAIMLQQSIRCTALAIAFSLFFYLSVLSLYGYF